MKFKILKINIKIFNKSAKFSIIFDNNPTKISRMWNILQNPFYKYILLSNLMFGTRVSVFIIDIIHIYSSHWTNPNEFWSSGVLFHFNFFQANKEKNIRRAKHMNKPETKTWVHGIWVGTIRYLVDPRTTTRN